MTYRFHGIAGPGVRGKNWYDGEPAKDALLVDVTAHTKNSVTIMLRGPGWWTEVLFEKDLGQGTIYFNGVAKTPPREELM